jgi:hypothetical protein
MISAYRFLSARPKVRKRVKRVLNVTKRHIYPDVQKRIPMNPSAKLADSPSIWYPKFMGA